MCQWLVIRIQTHRRERKGTTSVYCTVDHCTFTWKLWSLELSFWGWNQATVWLSLHFNLCQVSFKVSFSLRCLLTDNHTVNRWHICVEMLQRITCSLKDVKEVCVCIKMANKIMWCQHLNKVKVRAPSEPLGKWQMSVKTPVKSSFSVWFNPF